MPGNHHLGLVVQYKREDKRRRYCDSDYLVRLKCSDGQEQMIILELKGFEPDVDRQKEVAVCWWVRAVNDDGRFGRWDFIVWEEPLRLRELLRSRCGSN
ncbi:MAG: hypothetical protein RMJ57_06215 [Bacteroidia bacterium]|nr:hypothetical protein [Bacteroidia bacterium]